MSTPCETVGGQEDDACPRRFTSSTGLLERPLIVLKFGGTSVGSPARIRRAAKRVRARVRTGARVLVVVSAMGEATNRIIRWLHAVAPERGSGATREFDRALATGEDLSAALLAEALVSLGIPAVSLRGGEAGLEASGPFGDGEIQRLRADRLRTLLGQGIVPVVSGFQAVRPDGETVTLGRGGSDTTAAYLAGALGADACHIVTDVDGVYDRDPRLTPSARHLPHLRYETLVALAEAGAQVVHPGAASVAQRFGTPLRVYSFHAPSVPERETYIGPVETAAVPGGASAQAAFVDHATEALVLEAGS